MTTVWGDDERFVKTYFTTFRAKQVYSTFDWGIRDEDGYYFILGRTDDVINVAGHRLGTREIEEAVQAHANIAEVAVVGVADPLKGQMPLAFAVVKDPARSPRPSSAAQHEKEVMATVDRQLGAIARPVARAFRDAAAEDPLGQAAAPQHPGAGRGRDPGDLTTLEDPAALEQIRAAVTAPRLSGARDSTAGAPHLRGSSAGLTYSIGVGHRADAHLLDDDLGLGPGESAVTRASVV